MTHRILAFTLSLLVVACFGVVTGGCVEAGPEPADGKGITLPAYPAANELAPPAKTQPTVIGEFCLVTSCSEDEECQVSSLPAPVGCCEAGTCYRGLRFAGPTCFSAGTIPASETCPNDGDGDGVCAYQDRWYTRC